MRAAVIDGGIVANIIEVDGLDVFPGLVDAGNAQIGDLWDGASFSLPTSKSPTVKQYTEAVQQHLDTKARERNYDSVLSACTYATSTNARFQAEAQACVEWRDAVWSQCYATMSAVLSGHQAPPSVADLINSLPDLIWPE
jgi:hypothetical protein